MNINNRIMNLLATREAVYIANECAGIVVSKAGTSVVSWNELRNLT